MFRGIFSVMVLIVTGLLLAPGLDAQAKKPKKQPPNDTKQEPSQTPSSEPGTKNEQAKQIGEVILKGMNGKKVAILATAEFLQTMKATNFGVQANTDKTKSPQQAGHLLTCNAAWVQGAKAGLSYELYDKDGAMVGDTRTITLPKAMGKTRIVLLQLLPDDLDKVASVKLLVVDGLPMPQGKGLSEAEAEQAIKKMGGRVIRFGGPPALIHVFLSDERKENTNPSKPANVIRNSSKDTDETFKQLKAFKRLAVIELRGAPATDLGLKELRALDIGVQRLTLTTLILPHTKITDAGLKELRNLTSLRTLDLGFTAVTNDGLKELTGLKNLESLNLSGTKVTDAGLKELKELKLLKKLDIGGIRSTSPGVLELKRALPELKTIH